MSTHPNSAQLEREVEEQLHRIESRIGEIRERLSPGQIVDELLSYTKTGGHDFASNLGQTISNNPLPATLLGVSLIWLMSGQGPKLSAPRSEAVSRAEYPYATVSGGMRRVSHAADPSGKWYSEWEDTSGKRYKAESNELGHRASEFMDDAGRKFGGFIDEAGHRVRDFQDEAGNRLDEAAGWASHTFHDVQHGVTEAVSQAAHKAGELSGATQHQVDRTARMAANFVRDQPLVIGAVAFAAGAAIGAALPHTEQEDKAVGKLSDDLRRQAGEAASEAYEQGKAKAADLYDKGKEAAGQVYSEARDAATDRARDLH